MTLGNVDLRGVGNLRVFLKPLQWLILNTRFGGDDHCCGSSRQVLRCAQLFYSSGLGNELSYMIPDLGTFRREETSGNIFAGTTSCSAAEARNHKQLATAQRLKCWSSLL